jgi:glycosyltransferase involved in cell wall biosynthesis
MVAYTFYEADNRVRRYAEALAKRGDDVDAIALRREGQAYCEVIRGVRVYRIQERLIDEVGPFSYLRKLLLFFFRSMCFLAARNRKPRYDIIHVHSVPDFEVFATLIPKILGTRIILDIHDLVPEFYASKFKVGERSLVFRLLLLIETLSAAYADKVIVSNHLWREKLIERSVPPEKCIAIINYPDPSIFHLRPRLSATNGEFRMCYPGTLNQHQGLDVAVRAVALLRERVPNLRFFIVGDGPDREKLKKMLSQEQIEDRASIQGFVPLEKVADLMAGMDLGVVPKRKDSFGNEAFSTKIMEFMAMGVPVVASDTRIDQYYFNDHLLQFFESDNSEDLASKIQELVNNVKIRKALCAEALRYIEQNNWDVKKNEYLDLVNALVAQPTGTGHSHTR